MRCPLASLALFINLVLATPIIFKTVETATQKKEGSYIITLNSHIDKVSHIAELSKHLGGDEAVTHDWDSGFLNGFAAKLNSKALNYLRTHPDVCHLCSHLVMSDAQRQIQVATISEDGMASIYTVQVYDFSICVYSFEESQLSS
jgi:hypothetical protein